MNLFQTEPVRKAGLPAHSGSLAVALTAIMLLNSLPPAKACSSPVPSDPIYVSVQSPDLPFEEFTNGNIGIVRPSFGRKTLFIAYRYLNGGSFTTEEQNDLVKALKGTPPDEDEEAAVKAWIEARKEFVKEETLPEIYTEREYGGYDFFPNCAKNAFEVALQTLKDRAASYGADDKNVSAWLAAQDLVFENCDAGAQIPAELGAESVTWLRKDRDYQIAAAHFYSLKFDEARTRFEKIAADAESPWQEIAGYLVARTLIRQGSLGEETKKRALFEQAEGRLQTLVMNGGKYANAAKRLLGLVKYQIHPEERVVELSRILSAGGNENLRQDLIDYVWLLDKFEERIRKAEEERNKKEQDRAKAVDTESDYKPSPAAKQKWERLERGETIEVMFFQKVVNDNWSGLPGTTLEFKHDASEAEVLAAFAQNVGRELTAEEKANIKQSHENAVRNRQWRISPNRRFGYGGLSQYEGCYYDCAKLSIDLIPEFLRSEDLSDWILTIQSKDPGAYSHALSQWRKTGSPAWLITALVKADKSSPRLAKLMQAAEKVTRDDLAFPSVAYHLIRLKVAMGQTDEARKRLDEIISWQAAVLPVSAQNQFLELRMNLASDLSEFLKSAQRKPAVFYDYGMYGKLSDLLKVERFWEREYSELMDEEYEREREENYKALVPWEDRFGFDDSTREIFDWHFSLQLLAEAARNPNVPDYLQRSLALAAWTRAILLKNDEIARRIAPEVVKVQPEMAPVFESYLKAKTAKERSNAALYVMLKFPTLSPFVQGGLPKFETSEGIEYSFHRSWWCKPDNTEYNNEGTEVPRVVPKPNFLTDAQLETARREFDSLSAIGDAKKYLGKQAIEWAKSSPDDPRIPEALFIAAQANRSYKYGCGSWEQDDETKAEAETLLRERYPESPWTQKAQNK